MSRSSAIIATGYAIAVALVPMSALLFFGLSSGIKEGVLSTGALGIALLTFAVLCFFWKQEVALPASWLVLAWLPLLVVAILSLSFAEASPTIASVWGSSLETGTFASIVLFAVSVGVGSLVPRRIAATVIICGALIGTTMLLLSRGADTRPSFQDTEVVVASAHLESLPNALIGSGPNSFSNSWNQHRLVLFNTKPGWDKTPSVAWSTAFKIAVEFGVLGLAALLLCPLLLIAEGMRVSSGRAGIWFILALVVALFSIVVLYPIGTSIFLTTGISFGAGVRLLCARTVVISLRLPERVATVLASAVGGVILLWVAAHQGAAAHIATHAAERAAANDLAGAAHAYERAADLWPISAYESEAARAYLRYAFASPEHGGATDSTAAQTAIERTRVLAERPAMYHEERFDSQLTRASIYVSLAGAGVPGSVESARQAIQSAHSHARTRPEPFFLSAVLSLVEGKSTDAFSNVEKALNLKPDYEDAKKLFAQL